MKTIKAIAIDNDGNTLYLDINKIDGFQVNYEHMSIDVFLNGQIVYIDFNSTYEISEFIKSIMEE